MKIRRVWLAALVLVLGAACGGGGGRTSGSGTSSTTAPGESTTASSGAATQPTTAGSSSAPAVGHITQYVNGTLTINGADVRGAGRALAARDNLATGPAGESWFQLSRKVKECRVFPDSALQLSPAANVALRWDKGSSVCTTTGGSGTATFGVGARAMLTTSDPVFSVDVGTDQTAVRVLSGSMRVATSGAATVGLGPNQQVTIPNAGQPSIGPFDAAALPPAPQRAVRDYLAQQPPPNFSRPSPAGSTQLPRIYQRKVLIVGIDTALDDQSRQFVNDYFSFMARSWDLAPQPEVRQGALDTLTPLLQNRSIDLVVTPSPARAANTSAQTLFAPDGGGAAASFVVAPDAPYFAALKRFVVASVNAGAYGSRYQSAFGGSGVVVPYTPLLPLLLGG